MIPHSASTGPARRLAVALALAVCLAAGCGSSQPAAGEAPAAGFELDFERLAGAYESLPPADRDAVRDTVQLIRQGEHSLALDRLSALNTSTANNSALRILTSYALLQAGNLAGAFEQAEKAHSAPGPNAYTCWFLGKVAVLTGHREICEREIAHLRSGGTMGAAADELEKELAGQ